MSNKKDFGFSDYINRNKKIISGDWNWGGFMLGPFVGICVRSLPLMILWLIPILGNIVSAMIANDEISKYATKEQPGDIYYPEKLRMMFNSAGKLSFIVFFIGLVLWSTPLGCHGGWVKNLLKVSMGY